MAHIDYSLTPLIITAHLTSPLAGEAPYLDAVLEYVDRFVKKQTEKYTRDDSIPYPSGTFNLPLGKRVIGGVHIYAVSDPIVPQVVESVEYISTNMDTTLVTPFLEQDVTISKQRGQFKARRNPVKVRDVQKIVWFANGNAERIEYLLSRVPSVGDLRKAGYGIVSRWEIKEFKYDNSFFSDDNGVKVLMRTIPYDAVYAERNVGWVDSYGGYGPPYWHPDRQGRIMKPV